MNRTAVIAGAGVALAIGGFSLGRYAAPTKVETRERIVERQVMAKAETLATKQAETTAHVVGTKYVIRYLERPDGTKERTETAETKHSAVAAKRDEKVQTRTEVQYRDRIVEREKIVTQETRAGWSVTGSAGVGLDLRPRFGGGIEKRVLGPVWVGVWVMSDKSAGLSARWEL